MGRVLRCALGELYGGRVALVCAHGLSLHTSSGMSSQVSIPLRGRGSLEIGKGLRRLPHHCATLYGHHFALTDGTSHSPPKKTAVAPVCEFPPTVYDNSMVVVASLTCGVHGLIVAHPGSDVNRWIKSTTGKSICVRIMSNLLISPRQH